jgi:hypothetical protein
MKTTTLKRIWGEYEKKWQAGDFYDVIVNCIDQPCVRFFNGTVGAIPQKMMHLLPKELLETLAANAQARSIATAKELADERTEREKRLDEPGFHLLAGENTDAIYAGTWRECRNNLWRLLCKFEGKKLPRDRDCGKGCWVIVKGDFEAESGYFNSDMYW